MTNPVGKRQATAQHPNARPNPYLPLLLDMSCWVFACVPSALAIGCIFPKSALLLFAPCCESVMNPVGKRQATAQQAIAWLDPHLPLLLDMTVWLFAWVHTIVSWFSQVSLTEHPSERSIVSQTFDK